MKSVFLSIVFYLTAIFTCAQTGSIQGTVLDQQAETPLFGAVVELLGVEPALGAVTDEQGYFTLKGVPVGRNAVRITFIGYESITLPNIEVSAGKDVILNINLTESLVEMDEVLIVDETVKDRAQNEMATISARQFSLEEVNRFAGGRSDVARLAANFAGVSAPNDSRNDIVIRGNAPTGVLWRIEGIPVPNPNHFSTFGTTGGPVSALNPNVLNNSDFITSAFPAEYGNANAGVFDIGFRSGNRDRHERTIQVGAFTGFEAMFEGPLNDKGASYLLAGRYAFTGVIGAAGTAALPNYKDISFKVDLGPSKAGRLTLFGIGGDSDIEFLGADIREDDLFAAKDEDSFYKGEFGVVGMKHHLLLGTKTYLKTVLGASRQANTFENDRYFNLGTSDEFVRQLLDINSAETRYTVSSFLNTKLNVRQTLRAGILYEYFDSNSRLNDRENTPDINGDGLSDWVNVYDVNGGFSLIQPYVQSQYRVSEKLSLNAGIHGQYSTLNEQFVIEPRAALTYEIKENHKLSLGYGMHNQTASLPILFIHEEIDGELVRSNEKLDFIRSQHYVLGYDTKVGTDWRIKAEVYYQDIDRAPVDPFASSYSILTEGADFGFSSNKTGLVNEGTGYNQGVELTLEKFYSKGYYMLFTTSVFQSKYTSSDEKEYNTPFNNAYVVNVLGGKEFKVGKRNAVVIDSRLSTSGGKWYTPIDLQASQNFGFEVLQEDKAFSEQYDPYFRWDLKLGFKLNSSKRKLSQQFFVDFQNLTDRENIFARQYNRSANAIEQTNQIGLFVDFLYRVQF